MSAARLASAGLSFAGRYVGIGAPGPHDLDATELEEITGAGLGVMPVQYARSSGWSEATGGEDGQAAARNALAAGVPPETTLWCD